MSGKKINSIHFGGKMILIGVLLAILLPGIGYLCVGRWIWVLTIPGLLVLAAFCVIFSIEMKQDNGSIPYYERTLRETIPFDPEHQEAVIRSSICTGEKMAGFRDRKTGKFTEVMLVRTDEDCRRFAAIYEIDGEIKKIQ